MRASRQAALAGMMIAAFVAAGAGAPAKGWQPDQPITLVVPAGEGGGATEMARIVRDIVSRHRLAGQPIRVVNMAGGAGAEGFIAVKGRKGDPHTLIITLSNLFTTPLATGTPFGWKDFTPVAMLALDQFVLWVNADSPYGSARAYVDAVRLGADRQFRMAGTGAKQEDHIVTAALERVVADRKFTYIPTVGGAAAAAMLAAHRVDSTVNNPIEAVQYWRAGKLRPLCIFDGRRSIYAARVTADMAWSDIPTCREAGVDVEYQMLRGIFMPPGVTQAQVAYYVDLLEKVRATPEWAKLMEDGAFNRLSLTGRAFVQWLDAADGRHYQIMKDAGFLAKD